MNSGPIGPIVPVVLQAPIVLLRFSNLKPRLILNVLLTIGIIFCINIGNFILNEQISNNNIFQ